MFCIAYLKDIIKKLIRTNIKMLAEKSRKRNEIKLGFNLLN